MDDQTDRVVRTAKTLADITQIEANAVRAGRMNPELASALDKRASLLARDVLREQTGLTLVDLTPAEEHVAEAIATYIALKVRAGTNANLTIRQIKNRGLLGAAEEAVATAKPTTGFDALQEAGREDLSYERIVLDHPDEFTARAMWFSRRALGLPNDLAKAPARLQAPIHEHTSRLLAWVKSRRSAERLIKPFSYDQAAAALGWSDLQTFGRAYGNLQSRVDFACYLAGLPPLGLTAERPFDRAWQSEDRDWAFPVAAMQAAAQSRRWADEDFEKVETEARGLPGRAHIPWRREMVERAASVRSWAFGLAPSSTAAEVSDAGPREASSSRNPAWSRDELILALDLYWTLRGTSFGKDDDRIVELSLVLNELAAARGVVQGGDFRNANGVHMKLMNFRSADPEYTADGRVGLSRGNRLEAVLWDEFGGDRDGLAAAAQQIRASLFGDFTAAEAATVDALAALEERFRGARPETKERVSKAIERGGIGALVKMRNGYACQLCAALGRDPVGFRKKDGEPYVEAHHVMPVSRREVGSLAASNIITLCANHHRQLHYGVVDVAITPEAFELMIDGSMVTIPKLDLR